MSSTTHTYGPTCHFAPSAALSGRSGEDDIPPMRIQYFYASPLPIDDPLTAIPTPAGAESKGIRHPPRPFSAYDNNALEESWLDMASKKDKKFHKQSKNAVTSFGAAEVQKRASIVNSIAAKHNKKHENEEGKLGLKGETRKAFGKKFRPQKVDKDSQSKSKSPKPIIGEEPEEPRKTSRFVCAKCSSGPESCTCEQTKLGCDACPPSKSRTTDIITGKKTQMEDTAHTVAECSELSSQAPDNTSTASNNVHESNSEDDVPTCCAELERDVRTGYKDSLLGMTQRRDSTEEQKKLMQDVLTEARRQRALKKEKSSGYKSKSRSPSRKRDAGNLQADASNDSDPSKTAKGRGRRLKDQVTINVPTSKGESQETDPNRPDIRITPENDNIANIIPVSGNADAGTTGSPFQRAPSRKGSPRPETPSPDSNMRVARKDLQEDTESAAARPARSARATTSHTAAYCSDDDELPSGSYTGVMQDEDSDIEGETFKVHRCKAHKGSRTAEVPVGISRLHLVKIPALQMQPIYWSPVHDIAAVTRGTWFYRDSMYPVEPAVANQLELGYRELRPWSETWGDELNSAIEVGAAGEEKISHRLWPKETDLKLDPKSKIGSLIPAADPYCAARCYNGEVAAEGTVIPDNPDEKPGKTTELVKRFPNCQVIYKDSENAFILKPNLQPSEYFGRKPLAKIRKGYAVGIHVVRGFDWKAWEKLHPSKKDATARKAEHGAAVAGAADVNKGTSCPACLRMEERERVTDLVLVIHGIGQKLSERVESFHFTHAINSFRRSVNVELGNEAVKKVLREDLGGVMVLPVNWRSNLSFEEGGPMRDGDKNRAGDRSAEDYSLKDITPDTIPAVRNLISDVMLDIPFYMSQHKPKMISALIAEANRVYRLWCKNNPEFHQEGRVHIIAHSLGSAMALDVLSKQPTAVKNVKLDSKLQTKHFEFDTKNLFFVGSPAGFFLLLDKGRLMPRNGRKKPGVDYSDDNAPEITGDAGTFGCLAVDNLYNVMHYNDPIAYRLNATIDPLYAASIKNAQVPSATVGLLEAIGNKVRSITPGAANPTELGVGQMAKPTVMRLPSQLEMEVHDFTREEIAEKKFYLLNDNGQIDYFLSSGGGPLEIQYLNMLGAHSSYWTSPDFVRMLVTEVGRKPGKANALPNMKAAKAIQKKGERSG